MTPDRFARITSAYARLRIAVVGDFCLDRYLEIDPAREEISLETGLPVHNVTRVRAQPGGAGTILNNLAALGVGTIHPVGFCGEDGEGYELLRALGRLPGVQPEGMLQTPERSTFTYCKPLVVEPGKPPTELSRLDTKNWTPTPDEVQHELIRRLESLFPTVDGMILLEQVSLVETGVVTRRLLEKVASLATRRPGLKILADSRRGLGDYPAVDLKMNRAELQGLLGRQECPPVDEVKGQAAELARRKGRHVFVTLAEEGMVGAGPEGTVDHVPALPVRGPLDIVGAGDCVTANLAAALAAGACVAEALELAGAASSIVIHQLGTTGTASVAAIGSLLGIE